MMLVTAAAHAAAPAAPTDDFDLPIRAENPMNPAPSEIDPQDMADLEWSASVFRSLRAMTPTVCANLAVQPTPLPNGDFQYPLIPCGNLNVNAPLGAAVKQGSGPAETAPSRRPVPVQPQAGAGSAIEAPAVANDIDFNTLQMKRLGALDAMQGRPLNMNHASNLGYIQGYTEGQQRRMAPQGQRGFGGYNR